MRGVIASPVDATPRAVALASGRWEVRTTAPVALVVGADTPLALVVEPEAPMMLDAPGSLRVRRATPVNGTVWFVPREVR